VTKQKTPQRIRAPDNEALSPSARFHLLFLGVMVQRYLHFEHSFFVPRNR
jgi:hypothetical protein